MLKNPSAQVRRVLAKSRTPMTSFDIRYAIDKCQTPSSEIAPIIQGLLKGKQISRIRLASPLITCIDGRYGLAHFTYRITPRGREFHIND